MEQYVDEEIYEEEYEEESSFSKIRKILKYILIIAFLVLIVFAIIRNSSKSPVEDTTTINSNIFTQEYIVQNDLTKDEKVY
jgi:cell division protein FtsL